MNISINTRVESPGTFRLSENGDLLYKTAQGESIEVTPILCFPWMTQAEHISIRNNQGSELCLINNLIDLDEISQQSVAKALVPSAFMLNITHITEIRNEFELRSWKVITKQGPYCFQTPMDYWPRILNESTVLIQDVTGNMFCIEDFTKLDAESGKILWPFID